MHALAHTTLHLHTSPQPASGCPQWVLFFPWCIQVKKWWRRSEWGVRGLWHVWGWEENMNRWDDRTTPTVHHTSSSHASPSACLCFHLAAPQRPLSENHSVEAAEPPRTSGTVLVRSSRESTGCGTWSDVTRERCFHVIQSHNQDGRSSANQNYLQS